MAPFYAVMVDVVSVAGEALDIPSEVWDMTKKEERRRDPDLRHEPDYPHNPAYNAAVIALSKQLTGVPRVSIDPF